MSSSRMSQKLHTDTIPFINRYEPICGQVYSSNSFYLSTHRHTLFQNVSKIAYGHNPLHQQVLQFFYSCSRIIVPDIFAKWPILCVCVPSKIRLVISTDQHGHVQKIFATLLQRAASTICPYTVFKKSSQLHGIRKTQCWICFCYP
jgi:hypothetical protein